MAVNSERNTFVVEYLVDFNGTQAAIRTGSKPENAPMMAYRFLQEVEVQEAIQEQIEIRAKARALTVEWVLNQWREIASADPSDLIWVETECCRHCHGINHQYQWTQFEYDEVVRQCLDHTCGSKCEQPCGKRIPPLATGGFGFNPHEAPHEGCPACHGDGVEQVRVADTRRVRGAARRLCAGVKKTKDGIEIKMRDQDKALDNIAKFLGMIVNKNEIAGPGGGPISTVNFTAEDLSDDQIATMLLSENGGV